ncbi:hypothetical protein Barb6XT_02850 [Bacteroidales bacterium Barb6XT]|nr:hypothetical protein Barb6XT_02850 [Bacteroidales bacterium Barb6XT]
MSGSPGVTGQNIASDSGDYLLTQDKHLEGSIIEANKTVSQAAKKVNETKNGKEKDKKKETLQATKDAHAELKGQMDYKMQYNRHDESNIYMK